MSQIDRHTLEAILTSIQQTMAYLEHDIRNAKMWEDELDVCSYERGVSDALDLYDYHKDNMQDVITMITDAIHDNRDHTLPTSGQLPLPLNLKGKSND